ncbi:hypothetical protein, partial [Halobacillus alkaliphilus]|uniref:hypothetical protein n=1 Tax=Halobacillus alkaliphilus TaxID=396056 RepID=UPI001C31C582
CKTRIRDKLGPLLYVEEGWWGNNSSCSITRHSSHKPFINGLKNRHPFDARLMLVVSFGVIPHLYTFLWPYTT